VDPDVLRGVLALLYVATNRLSFVTVPHDAALTALGHSFQPSAAALGSASRMTYVLGCEPSKMSSSSIVS